MLFTQDGNKTKPEKDGGNTINVTPSNQKLCPFLTRCNKCSAERKRTQPSQNEEHNCCTGHVFDKATKSITAPPPEHVAGGQHANWKESVGCLDKVEQVLVGLDDECIESFRREEVGEYRTYRVLRDGSAASYSQMVYRKTCADEDHTGSRSVRRSPSAMANYGKGRG